MTPTSSTTGSPAWMSSLPPLSMITLREQILRRLELLFAQRVILAPQLHLAGEEIGHAHYELHRGHRDALDGIGKQGEPGAQGLRVAETRIEHHQQEREYDEKHQSNQRGGTTVEKRWRLAFHLSGKREARRAERKNPRPQPPRRA